jgi:hypothetical protein
MEDMMETAKAAMARPGWPPGAVATWSFDNDRIHQNPVTLARLKINSRNRFPLPPNSPDMHRVIEHTVGRLKTAFRKWLYAHPGPRSNKQYQAVLERIFYECPKVAGPAAIKKDVLGLPKLFKLIRLARGGWPPKREL